MRKEIPSSDALLAIPFHSVHHWISLCPLLKASALPLIVLAAILWATARLQLFQVHYERSWSLLPVCCTFTPSCHPFSPFLDFNSLLLDSLHPIFVSSLGIDPVDGHIRLVTIEQIENPSSDPQPLLTVPFSVRFGCKCVERWQSMRQGSSMWQL